MSFNTPYQSLCGFISQLQSWKNFFFWKKYKHVIFAELMFCWRTSRNGSLLPGEKIKSLLRGHRLDNLYVYFFEQQTQAMFYFDNKFKTR